MRLEVNPMYNTYFFHSKTNPKMIRAASLILAFATASAFSPSGRVSRLASLKMASPYDNEIGVQPPLGFWDPLGLLEDADQERFDRLRYVEVKHGRIAQLAILGHLVTSAGIRNYGDITPGKFSLNLCLDYCKLVSITQDSLSPQSEADLLHSRISQFGVLFNLLHLLDC